jgi:hypothetical protein
MTAAITDPAIIKPAARRSLLQVSQPRADPESKGFDLVPPDVDLHRLFQGEA